MNIELDPYSRAAREFMSLLATASTSNDYHLAAVARTLLRRTLVTAEEMAVLDGCPAQCARVAALRAAAAPWLAASTPTPSPVPADRASILAEIQRYLQRAKPIFAQALTAFPFLGASPSEHVHAADGVTAADAGQGRADAHVMPLSDPAPQCPPRSSSERGCAVADVGP